MSLKSFEKLISSITSDEEKDYDRIVNQAHTEGEALYNDMIKKAKLKIEKQKERNEINLKHMYQQQVRIIENEIQKDLVLLKNDYVQQFLNASINDLENMSDEALFALIDRVLNDEKDHHRPRIYIDSAHYASVLAKYGASYQVVEKSDLTTGFILSYEQFDIDFEFKNLLLYHEEVLHKIAQIKLFEAQDEH